MDAQSTQFRLVWCIRDLRILGRVPKIRVFGLLYAEDAGRWSQPLWSFRAQPTDPLAAVPPGSLVEVNRAPQRGERITIRTGPFSFRISTPLVPGAPEIGGRLFAEAGDVVMHPALAGESHVPRGAAVAAREGFQGFADLLRMLHPPWRRWAPPQADPLGRSMTMRVRWVVGDRLGPLAVAQLRAPETPPDRRPRELGVVNVPDALVELEPRDHDCVVHGDLARGIVTIDVNGATLYPAPGPYRSVPPPLTA